MFGNEKWHMNKPPQHAMSVLVICYVGSLHGKQRNNNNILILIIIITTSNLSVSLMLLLLLFIYFAIVNNLATPWVGGMRCF